MPKRYPPELRRKVLDLVAAGRRVALRGSRPGHALVAEGLTSKEIATQLYISTRTVDKHIERLLAKTGASRRGELRKLTT